MWSRRIATRTVHLAAYYPSEECSSDLVVRGHRLRRDDPRYRTTIIVVRTAARPTIGYEVMAFIT